ncbi:phosphatidylserine decarboxylase family protein [Desulfatiglans anilini]|uniref:phosphatidylserine decarboxylase family protein n=1 Tax=Desulfatiglans anilini TaxID=90728 RepID=UPI0004108A82|nr:phosphatidylserine decarboxylase family protein [Desulfatiglans anilini]
MEASRIHNRWPIAREGLPFILIAAGLTGFTALLGWTWLSVLLGILTLFVTSFFRDPERISSAAPHAVLSPADGRILKVEHIESPDNPLKAPAEKVSIFMTVFNVHVNRIPVSATILETIYSPGKFFSADLDKASDENEKNSLVLATRDGRKLVVVQIAGLIARRIACWVKPGDFLNAGERFGLIRFGSRLEVFVPAGSAIVAAPGRKVRAGETVIGYLDGPSESER